MSKNEENKSQGVAIDLTGGDNKNFTWGQIRAAMYRIHLGNVKQAENIKRPIPQLPASHPSQAAWTADYVRKLEIGHEIVMENLKNELFGINKPKDKEKKND